MIQCTLFFILANYWNFTQACAIINTMEHRLGARPSHKSLIPMLQDIKHHLIDFQRTLVNEKDSLLIPVSLKETGATLREFIDRKQTTFDKKGVNTFKGHKVIHVKDDVEGKLIGRPSNNLQSLIRLPANHDQMSKI